MTDLTAIKDYLTEMSERGDGQAANLLDQIISEYSPHPKNYEYAITVTAVEKNAYKVSVTAPDWGTAREKALEHYTGGNSAYGVELMDVEYGVGYPDVDQPAQITEINGLEL